MVDDPIVVENEHGKFRLKIYRGSDDRFAGWSVSQYLPQMNLWKLLEKQRGKFCSLARARRDGDRALQLWSKTDTAPVTGKSALALCPDCGRPLTLYRGWDIMTGADQWYCFSCACPRLPADKNTPTKRKSAVQKLNAGIEEALSRPAKLE